MAPVSPPSLHRYQVPCILQRRCLLELLLPDEVMLSSVCGFQVGCKLSLVFLQYCIMANFFWLLVEGLYLHTLLVAVLPPGRCFLAYLLIGWGKRAPSDPQNLHPIPSDQTTQSLSAQKNTLPPL